MDEVDLLTVLKSIDRRLALMTGKEERDVRKAHRGHPDNARAPRDVGCDQRPDREPGACEDRERERPGGAAIREGPARRRPRHGRGDRAGDCGRQGRGRGRPVVLEATGVLGVRANVYRRPSKPSALLPGCILGRQGARARIAWRADGFSRAPTPPAPALPSAPPLHHRVVRVSDAQVQFVAQVRYSQQSAPERRRHRGLTARHRCLHSA